MHSCLPPLSPVGRNKKIQKKNSEKEIQFEISLGENFKLCVIWEEEKEMIILNYVPGKPERNREKWGQREGDPIEERDGNHEILEVVGFCSFLRVLPELHRVCFEIFPWNLNVSR